MKGWDEVKEGNMKKKSPITEGGPENQEKKHCNHKNYNCT